MLERTSTKSHYAVVIGKQVQYFARPKPVGGKKYREPVLVEKRNCKTKTEAIKAKETWDQLFGGKQ